MIEIKLKLDFSINIVNIVIYDIIIIEYNLIKFIYFKLL